ncbi:hypothetical protein O181_020874 [Austropuccinia psidii MF-1]|uniref:Uncharacterized protein n=1 Tax=Austropuccinia psidii MF-1 TaxID=1389203 RepID=A0A9Q3CC38_9BASI|nr:hypothetical protein [Austropuccinia psidii MF-1]
MIPPHFRKFGFPRDYSLQREATICRNRGLERREVEIEIVQSHKTWQNEPSYTFQAGFQHQTSRNGLHRTVYSNPSNIQRNSPLENGRQGIQPRAPLERTCRKYSEDFPKRDIVQRAYHRREIEPERSYSYFFRLTRSGKPTKLPSGFTPLGHQQTSGQESPYFQIPERVRPYDAETVGPSGRSTKNNKKAVNTSNEARRPKIRNDISTHIGNNGVIPESTISSNTLWLQFSQFLEQTQKEFERLHDNISRLQEVNTLETKTINTLQEDYTKLSKASEETKVGLNQVFEEQNHCKRDSKHLDQYIEKLVNVCQNIKP